MQKLTIEDLESITERVKKTKLLSEGAGRAKITVHMGTCRQGKNSPGGGIRQKQPRWGAVNHLRLCRDVLPGTDDDG